MSRWWSFLRFRRRQEELDEEIQAHLAMARQDRIDRGETRQEAEANVLREFGNVTAVREVTREMWGWSWLKRSCRICAARYAVSCGVRGSQWSRF